MNKNAALSSHVLTQITSAPTSDDLDFTLAGKPALTLSPVEQTGNAAMPVTLQHKLPLLFLNWQQKTRQANLALLQQQLPKAHQLYQQALTIAQQLQQLDPMQHSHLAAYVISHHNLADLALLEGEAHTARTLLGHAYQHLWTLCNALPDLQENLLLVLPHLHTCRHELAFFCQNFGTDEASSQLMRLPWPGAQH